MAETLSANLLQHDDNAMFMLHVHANEIYCSWFPFVPRPAFR